MVNLCDLLQLIEERLMGIYGKAAVGAVELYRQGRVDSPVEAWERAIKKVTNSPSSQVKGCPRDTFLGLCEEGLVAGIKPGNYTGSVDNKRYALRAITLLRKDEGLADSPGKLWRAVMAGEQKAPNSQMDVVVGLWKEGLIRP